MKKWSLSSKIYFVIFIMAMGLCTVSAIGIIQMANINTILNTITQDRVTNLVRTHKIMSHFYIQIINERNYILHETVKARMKNKGFITQRHEELVDMIDARAKVSSPEGLKDLLEFKETYQKWTEFNLEAARAGEQGKGFAVVAEEVGNLAQMSGNAADEISVLLDNSIHKVESIVRNTQEKVEVLIKEGSHKIEAGTRIAKECGDVLEEIVDNTAKVTKMTAEISTACQEQSMGVQEITRAMNMLDQVTQTNTASSEESASAAEELSAQATSLKGVVDLLVVTIKGGDRYQAGASLQQPEVRTSNVVSIKAAPKVTAPTPKKTAHVHKTKTVRPSMPVKKAVGMGGSSNSLPMGNDPRFEDV